MLKSLFVVTRSGQELPFWAAQFLPLQAVRKIVVRELLSRRIIKEVDFDKFRRARYFY